MRFFRVALVFAATLFAASVFAGGEPPKNLQVLPKTTTRDQVKVIMKAQSKALGVECDFCHDTSDMSSDANGHKKVARQMMKMTDDINAKWIKTTIHDWDKHPVTCATCHRGQSSPTE